ncbi:glycoside hydrolase family 32 protein [Streptomyces europaeiscabiei]|uniref:glycoside hydrolase family 32 protein n=1 Tax=Streptomyces europaeiscabiei TaxID=146819 RepID=UPI0029A17049|nr:glycoside hydrolase family 32 protein [Streptomyces europaeiscabiei]MDX3707728.1 glycoside hydrolase family 32 protein [Streptomyces europaeiscabiei]
MSTTPAPRDPHYPVAHLRPPRNWINDPNGLVFHDGHYHVFYQYNPYGATHANMHWGHFRSPDLLTWEPLPIALSPTTGGVDADGCFSGNAVSDGDRLVAFYSAHREDRSPQHQPVTCAVSHDDGRTFSPRAELLIPELPKDCTMYRDPYVWQDDGGWRMLVGAALADGRAAALLYDSPDLETWTYRGPFAAREKEPIVGTSLHTGEGWECSQYLPAASGPGALVFSAWNLDDGPQCVAALMGEEHGDVFEAGPPVLVDHGPDCYAPALLRAPGNRWLLWGWSWEARDEAWAVADRWAGVLTLPREIHVDGDGTLRQQPATELLALRGEHIIHAAGATHGPQPVDLGSVSRAFDLTARLEPTGNAGLRLLTNPDGSEYLDIRLDVDAGELVVDRDHASLDPRARGGSYRMPCATDRPVELRMVVDHSIAEIFLTTTGQVLTLRFYPTGRGAWRLQAHSTPGRRLGHAIDVWELHPLVIKEPSTGASPRARGRRAGAPSGT